MENPIYIEMAEDLETCIEELSSIVGVIKIFDAHLKDDPDAASNANACFSSCAATKAFNVAK